MLSPRAFVAVALVATTTILSAAQRAEAPASARPALDPALLTDLTFRNVGPAVTGGRIVEFAVVESQPSTIYAATASGGAFKTVNAGTTWTPVFDRERTVSIGAIALSQSRPDVVWIGTGEANAVRSSSWGDGVYKSVDAGKTWTHMGLDKSQHVGRIAIHPTNPDIVYVAALGALWAPNDERGLFKTTDGGKTWTKSLGVSKYTGVVDVAFDPRDPDVVYAAAYQRERRYYSFVGGGPEGAIHKSTDGGATWKKLTDGLPSGPVGRIGLATCRTKPERLYAAVVGPEGGIFRSDDRGEHWEKRNATLSTHWYYGQIYCDPNDAERVFVPMTRFSVSTDGAKTFRDDFARGGVHVDHHTFWVDPGNSRHMLLGNDGGIYISWDDGASWEFQDHLSIAQFYTVAVDMQEPFYYVYGGTQDNSSYGGPSGTRSSDGIVNADWYLTVGGDGFYAQIDPTDPTIVYSESQYGNVYRFDTRSGERTFIQPQPPQGQKYRWNWSTPILISPHDPKTVYIAANHLFRTRDRGEAWETISPDLTRQVDEFTLPLQDKVQPRDAIDLHASTADYGNITTISESPLKAGVIAVGTDDGLVQTTRDGGKSWTKSEAFPGVPEQTRVSRVVLSKFAEGTIYATFDGHQDNNFKPLVLKSTDYGVTWSSISSNLPDDGPVHVIAEHPRTARLLFVGTEFGVFVTIDGGGSWTQLRNNLPTVAVHDIVIHPRDNDLVLGTHGRGIWILDDLSALEALTPETLASGSALFPVRRGWQFHRFNRGRGSTGQQRFIGANPPDGAIISYLAKQGDKVEIEIVDAAGTVVRRLTPRPPAATGIVRTIWDLRYAAPVDRPAASGGEEEEAPVTGPRGSFVMPGPYQIRLRNGTRQHVGTVTVLSDPLEPLSDSDRRIWHDTLTELATLYRGSRTAVTTVEQLTGALRTVREAIAAKPSAAASVGEAEKTFSAEVTAINRLLRGDPPRGIALTPGPPALAQRVAQLYSTVEGSTGLPTADQKRLTALSHEQMAEVVTRINHLTQESLPAFQKQLAAQHIAWPDGRPATFAPLVLKLEP